MTENEQDQTTDATHDPETEPGESKSVSAVQEEYQQAQLDHAGDEYVSEDPRLNQSEEAVAPTQPVEELLPLDVRDEPEIGRNAMQEPTPQSYQPTPEEAGALRNQEASEDAVAEAS